LFSGFLALARAASVIAATTAAWVVVAAVIASLLVVLSFLWTQRELRLGERPSSRRTPAI